MTEQELKDIQAGLKRWHVVSIDTAQKLLDEIYRLRHHAAMEQMHLDLVYRERDEAYTYLALRNKTTDQ
jgi:hypothetical protein